MNLESLPADAVEAVFARHGAEAVTLSDAGDDPVLEPGPGETPLWDKVRITALFAPTADLAALRRDLCQSLQIGELPAWHVECLPDRVWEREWLRDFRPMRFGRRLWISPDHQVVDAGLDAYPVIVYLDPGLAFGTGAHPTTAMCLEWLDEQELAGRLLLDFGCGSGILSIAAIKLGANRAVALDNDPQALTATRSNALQNGVDDRIVTASDAALLSAEFDVIVANVLAGPLRHHARTICSRLLPGGALALAGILEEQAASVARAYAEWIDFAPPKVRSPWVFLSGTRTLARETHVHTMP
jgi:ribosomal protein L11 methyltransferase